MELLRYAVSGFNIIPTALLGLMTFYWLVAILGIFDFDFDFDVDVDIEMEGADAAGPLAGIALFINIGQVPIALVFSLLVLNNWILAMMLYYLPIKAGGIINGVLLIPVFLLSILITKFEIQPLKGVFKGKKRNNGIDDRIMDKRCTVISEVAYDRLGQAEVEKEGASIVINAKSEFKSEVFKKGETAFVFRKDEDKDLYYLTRPLLQEEFYFSKDGGKL